VRDIPEENKEQVEKAYATLVEQDSNIDDEIAEAVLEEKEITPEISRQASAVRRSRISLCLWSVDRLSRTRAFSILVDAVIDYLPGPLDIPPAKGMEPDTHEPMDAPTDDNGKFCSLAFKLWSDPFVGKLVFFASIQDR